MLQDASFRLIHSPVRFEKVILDLLEERKEAIKDIGFGGLLRMPKMTVRKSMIVDIAKTYQVSNRTFKICDQDFPMYLEDVHDILGLEIEGTDADEYIQQIKISEEKNVQTPLYQRFADANNKLGLKRLEDMIRDKKNSR